MQNKSIPYLLSIIAIVGFVTSVLVPPLSFLIFLTIAALLGLLNKEHTIRYKDFDFLILISLMTGYISWALAGHSHLVTAIVHSCAIWLAFVAYILIGKYAINRMGYFTIAVFWLAIEHILLWLNPDHAYFILGSVFDHMPGWILWNEYTGLQGVSAWIILGGVLPYYSLFKDDAVFNGKIRWLSIFYSFVLISLPIALNLIFFSGSIYFTSQTVYEAYKTDEYQINGRYIEWMGRTAVWVSIFAILYAAVNKRIKR